MTANRVLASNQWRLQLTQKLLGPAVIETLADALMAAQGGPNGKIIGIDISERMLDCAKALSPGRKWAVLDYKMPSGWQRIFAPLFVALGSSFGISKDLMERHVWEAVERHLKHTKMQELYGGFVYIVSGEAPLN